MLSTVYAPRVGIILSVCSIQICCTNTGTFTPTAFIQWAIIVLESAGVKTLKWKPIILQDITKWNVTLHFYSSRKRKRKKSFCFHFGPLRHCLLRDRLVIPDVSKKWHPTGGRLAGQKWRYPWASKQHWRATLPKSKHRWGANLSLYINIEFKEHSQNCNNYLITLSIQYLWSVFAIGREAHIGKAVRTGVNIIKPFFSLPQMV